MKNAQDTQLHFAIEQTIMDLIDNGCPREEINKMMAEKNPKMVDRVRHYLELWAGIKAEIDANA